MAKVTYASLKLKVDNSVETFDFNGNTIEVLKYLPIQDKYDLIMTTLERAEEEGVYNPVTLEAYFHLYLVYMYTNLKQGMLFVVGQENMSKTRFCLMSLLPNIIFGFIPFIIYMINPTLEILGELGAFSIAAGVGDYLNVFNALTQMPKGAKTYLSGMHSYWYLPEKN